MKKEKTGNNGRDIFFGVPEEFRKLICDIYVDEEPIEKGLYYLLLRERFEKEEMDEEHNLLLYLHCFNLFFIICMYGTGDNRWERNADRIHVLLNKANADLKKYLLMINSAPTHKEPIRNNGEFDVAKLIQNFDFHNFYFHVIKKEYEVSNIFEERIVKSTRRNLDYLLSSPDPVKLMEEGKNGIDAHYFPELGYWTDTFDLYIREAFWAEYAISAVNSIDSIIGHLLDGSWKGQRNDLRQLLASAYLDKEIIMASNATDDILKEIQECDMRKEELDSRASRIIKMVENRKKEWLNAQSVKKSQ